MTSVGPDVALVCCAEFPEGEDDTRGIVPALAARGVDAAWVPWDAPGFDWAATGVAALRSTWDYTRRRPEFLAWADGVPRLANTAPVVRWNSDKTYLRDLGERGLPVVPTSWAEPGQPVDLPDGVAPGDDVVVKPSVGAGSLGVGRFGPGPDQLQRVREHAAGLHAVGRTAMVQPYQSGVDDEGETALVFLGGRYSHAIRKGAMLPADTAHELPTEGTTRRLFVEENITVRQAARKQTDVAGRILDALPLDDELLYARVDLLPGPDGPVLVELELIEPSLFLSWVDGATDRYADAVVARLNGSA